MIRTDPGSRSLGSDPGLRFWVPRTCLVLSQVISLLVAGTGILIRLEIEQSFIQLSNDILIGWITLQYFAA